MSFCINLVIFGIHNVKLCYTSRVQQVSQMSHTEIDDFCASDIRLRTMLTENEYIFKNTGLKYPNSKREHTQF
jgi:hypothetical protein